MTPYLDDGDVQVYQGDCREVMRELADASIDVVICDPPYGLEFMGKDWDSFKPSNACVRTRIDGRTNGAEKSVVQTPEAYVAGQPFQAWCESWAREAYRVLKPGGHLAAFGGTRTYHRLAAGIEDAGFEIRDTLCWIYGSGFPKSLDVSKAIDKAAGATRPVLGVAKGAGSTDTESLGPYAPTYDATAPATDEARDWQGWGTALKPAHEPIVLARKPLAGTVARNVLEHGTGALNIDGTRIGHASDADLATSLAKNPGRTDTVTSDVYGAGRPQQSVNVEGRWPANVILDEGAGAMLDAQTGELQPGASPAKRGLGSARVYGDAERSGVAKDREQLNGGGASRFFYTAKASSADRALTTGGKSDHPTVKPVDLMRWLVRLLTPPGGLILDPFLGSGTTAVAARLEGFRCIGIEQHEPYARIAADRLSQQSLLGGAA